MNRGNRTAAVAIAFGILVAVIVVVNSWDKIVETYYVYRLEIGDERERISVTESLARLGRISSVPPLLERFLSDGSEGVRRASLHALSRIRLGTHSEEVFQSIATALRKSASGVLSSLERGEKMLDVSVTRPNSEFVVKIEFDGHVPWQAVVSVIDVCKSFELDNVTLRRLDSGSTDKPTIQRRSRSAHRAPQQRP